MKKFFVLAILASCIAYAAGTIPSANMGMPIPQVGVEPGPQWATDINNSLTIIDRHDHSPGSGVQITPAGINISTDLPFNGNNATLLRSSRYTPQDAPLSGALDLGAVYVSGVDLYYNDGLGNQVRITQGGSVTGVSGSITGLVSPASAAYSPGTQTFIWQSDVNKAANMDFRSAIFRNSTTSSFGLTLEAPALTSDYNITLPLLTANNSILSINTSGAISAGIGMFDQSTITSDGATVKVPTGGITTTQIATNTILASNIADHVIGLTQLQNSVLQWNSHTFTITTPGFNVRAATTVNGALGTAYHNGSVIDGVTLATNDLILVKNQTTSTEDGVYVVQVSGTPTRSTSYNTFTQFNYAGVHVTAGTASTNTNWFQNNILTSLADNQSWSQSSTQAFVVPANVNRIYALGIGGGGGGGSEGNGPTGGGGGGAGVPSLQSFTVIPADTLNITTGFLGKGGVVSGSGNPGQSGSNSVISGTSVSVIFPGGGGGGNGNVPGGNSVGRGGLSSTSSSLGGGGGGSTGDGGNGGVSSGSSITAQDGANGGGGAGGDLSGAGKSGGPSVYSFTRAAGGTSLGGGGGGSGFDIGGAGGSSGAAGSNAPTADSGAGGGGGGGSASGHGGNGASGKITIYWLGAAS